MSDKPNAPRRSRSKQATEPVETIEPQVAAPPVESASPADASPEPVSPDTAVVLVAPGAPASSASISVWPGYLKPASRQDSFEIGAVTMACSTPAWAAAVRQDSNSGAT